MDKVKAAFAWYIAQPLKVKAGIAGAVVVILGGILGWVF